MKLLSLTVGSALLGAALAAPSPSSEGSLFLSVPLVQNPKVLAKRDSDPIASLVQNIAGLRQKYDRGLTAYHQNTGHRSPLDGRKGGKRRAVGEVALDDVNNYQLWQGKFGIGTPNVDVLIDFDTGSSDVFVNPNEGYDPKNSSSAVDTGKSFELNYGDGTKSAGPVYNDTILVGGLGATNQAIGAANVSSLDTGTTGVAGMGFPSLSQYQRLPFFYTLQAEGVVKKGVFGFALYRQNAELTLGGINHSKFHGPLAWNSVNASDGFWVIREATFTGKYPTSANASIESDGKVSASLQKGRKAVITSTYNLVDTGTSVLIGPTAEVQSFYSALNISTQVQDGLLVAFYETTPSVSVHIGGRDYPLSDESFNYRTMTNGTKMGAIVGADLGLPDGAWIIGDTFFQNVYAAFDIDRESIGLARARD